MEQVAENKSWIKEFFEKLFFLFHDNQKMITSEEAYNNATYGSKMNRERFIIKKQVDINRLIKEKFNNSTYGETDYDKYFLIVGLTLVEEECSTEIFEPFIKDGYKIVKISEKIEELKTENVYLITWKQ